MWLDRLTQEKVEELPHQVEPARFQWQGKRTECLNGHSNISYGNLLVGDGAERCQLLSKSYAFLLPKKDKSTNIDLFSDAITTIGKKLDDRNELPSPMLPAAVINSESHLLPLEMRLERVLDKGHLHQISQNPRLDIRYDEEVIDVARAKRLAKGALVHLASHSECWQRQTLNGIVPKKVKARFSEDDLNIYENRVYSRLLDELDQHLNSRIRTVVELNDTLSKALELHNDKNKHHLLIQKICTLWGQTFNEEATAKTLELLEDTLTRLQKMHLKIRNLKQGGLYLMVARQTITGRALHRTNILNHDAHYRYLAILWDELSKHQQKSIRSPSEAFEYEQELTEYYSRFSGLVLQQALQRYLDENDKGIYHSTELSFDWSGRKLTVKKEQYDWKLILLGPEHKTETMLHIVPCMNFTDMPDMVSVPDNTLIVWPALDKIPANQPISDNHGVAISPMDLYCIERLGWFIDKKLNQVLVRNYEESIKKIPKAPEKWLKENAIESSIQLDDSHPPELKILEDLSDKHLNLLIKQLEGSNAKAQGQTVKARVMEIRTLQCCPVCESTTNRLHHQKNGSFRVQCTKCPTSRYLRRTNDGQVYEIKMDAENITNGFAACGRWFQS
ncbi:MAG: hypothetical protein RPS47_12960 [Colwellia sp.]|jgi:hypothetical protein